jgi:hypothetical protein
VANATHHGENGDVNGTSSSPMRARGGRKDLKRDKTKTKGKLEKHPSHSSIKFPGIIKHTAEAIPLGVKYTIPLGIKHPTKVIPLGITAQKSGLCGS